jgi:hypothetical protein
MRMVHRRGNNSEAAMRKRYVTASNRPRLYSYDDEPVHLTGTTVFEPEPQMVDTGILDASGQPIMFYETLAPIGFIHHGEEA